MKLIIWVDGDNKIGMGHVYRSLNLAKAIKTKNHQIIFLTSSVIVKKMTKNKFPCIIINRNNLDEIRTIIFAEKPDIIIIDKLREKSDILEIFNSATQKIVGIDYIGKNWKLIKFGINILYPKQGMKTKKAISGLEYAILNEAFKKERKIEIVKKVKSLLVIQGGSDTNCLTPQIIQIINNIDEDLNVTIMLGPSFQCWRKLKKSLKNTTKHFKILHNVKNVVPIMKNNDIAITSGGMTLLELCKLGVPSIVTCGANFEQETANYLGKKGFGINIGYYMSLPKKKTKLAIQDLINNYSKRKEMNMIGPLLIDGKGSNRVAKIILEVIK